MESKSIVPKLSTMFNKSSLLEEETFQFQFSLPKKSKKSKKKKKKSKTTIHPSVENANDAVSGDEGEDSSECEVETVLKGDEAQIESHSVNGFQTEPEPVIAEADCTEHRDCNQTENEVPEISDKKKKKNSKKKKPKSAGLDKLIEAVDSLKVNSSPVYWRPAITHNLSKAEVMASVEAGKATTGDVSSPTSQKLAQLTSKPLSSKPKDNDAKTATFISPKDSIWDESARIKLKYGNGKNLVAIGPPKKRGIPAWALPPPGFETVAPASSNTKPLAKTTRNAGPKAAAISMAGTGSGNAAHSSGPALHSSPFTFGFGV